MISKTRTQAAALAALSMLVTACGGGDGTDAAQPAVSTSTPPAISAQPVISAQPANAAALSEGSATFSVTASGAGLTYQWKRNGVDIPGATSASYAAPVASAADSSAQYTVVVSNASGSVTSAPAKVALTLSPNQQAFENMILAPASGSYMLHWNLQYDQAQVSGRNYAYSDHAVMESSPLTNGPQTQTQSAPYKFNRTLTMITPGPTRVLKNGAIHVAPVVGTVNRVTYVGGDVRVDTLANDNNTVAFSEIRSNYETVALTGAIASTPADFARFHNAIFSNPGVLDASLSYAAGASYLKFTQTNKGDRYNVFDCFSATADAAVSPCRTATTLTAFMTAGIASNSDGTTYRLADGSIRTVNGVSIWVATVPRPQSASQSSTVQYRIYFELNGNVYTGALINDGTVLGGGAYVSNPNGATVAERFTYLPFDIRMNKAAHDSLLAALKI